MALDISIGLSAGYDDNISQEQTAASSGFTLHQIKIDQPFLSALSYINGNIFIDGTYQNYYEVADNYELRGGLSFTFPLAKGQFLPHIFSEAAIYRDNFISEDERDEIMAGCAFEWLATGRLTLIARQSFRWLDYKEQVILSTSSSHSNSGMGWGGGHGSGGQGEHQQQQSFSRDDRISSTGLEGRFFFSPNLEAYLSAEYNYLNSSVETETYRQNGVNASLLWKLYSTWEITAKSFWKDTDYDDQALDRRDKTYSVSLGVSYFIRNFEIFFQIEHTENDSSLDEETYNQMVTQCGAVFSF